MMGCIFSRTYEAHVLETALRIHKEIEYLLRLPSVCISMTVVQTCDAVNRESFDVIEQRVRSYMPITPVDLIVNAAILSVLRLLRAAAQDCRAEMVDTAVFITDVAHVCLQK